MLVPILIACASVPLGVMSVGNDGLCSPSSEVHCRDGHDNAICVDREQACSFNEVHCQREPDDGADPSRLLWPKDKLKHQVNFDDFTANTQPQVDIGDMHFYSYCYFGSYVNGIRGLIFNRELRTWPGEPNARPSRPFGLSKFDVSCADFNNSDHDGLGFNVIVPDRLDETVAMPLRKTLEAVYHIDELNIMWEDNEKREYYTNTKMSACAVGGSDALAVKKFDVEKGWKKVYGARFFSEGIVDIRGSCPSEYEMPASEFDNLKHGFGNFTDDYEDKRIFRGNDFWTWSKGKKCPDDHLVCMLEGRFNELVGIYKLNFWCCPKDRSELKGVEAPPTWEQSGFNVPPKLGEPCRCADGSNGTMVTGSHKHLSSAVTKRMSTTRKAVEPANAGILNLNN